MAEIRPLTGLRGLAALTVFLSHLQMSLFQYGLPVDLPEWAKRLFLNSGPQVDIFFVLSGFILTMNYRKWFEESITAPAYATFLRRRFARIYPLHFVVLVMVIGFVVAAHATGAPTRQGLGRFQANELPAYFLLMQAWGLLFPEEGGWNPPSWSISIEALAYLFFPILIWISAKRSALRPWRMVALCAVFGIGLNLLTPWGVSGFGAIARGLSEFALGCFAMGLVDSKAAAWFQRDKGSVVAVSGLAVSFLLTPAANFLAAICCVPVLLALCRGNLASRFFRWQPVFFLGEISYSIYLGHFLFGSISFRLVSIAWMKSGSLPLVIGIVLIVSFVLALSALCYYTIEQPGRRLLSGRRRAETGGPKLENA